MHAHRRSPSGVLPVQVSANTERLVALETFEHLQSLSLQFHLKRETGSVLRSVSRGASSFAGLMRIILFQILPVFIQVIVVCIYLFLKYEWSVTTTLDSLWLRGAN